MFPTTLLGAAQKWYYKYPPRKLPTYKKIKKAFLTRFRDDKTHEELLCDLGKIKQRKISIRKYMERIKDLTKQLDSEPDDKSMHAWFLNGSNSEKLQDNEIIHPTKTFDELVARALNIEKKTLKDQES